MPQFIPGRQLAEQFFAEVVNPILDSNLSHRYAAALLGAGSDVLGFDDGTSMDHGWGPRVQILTDRPVSKAEAESIREKLPPDFLGFKLSQSEPYYKAVEFFTVDEILQATLGPALPSPSEPLNWLLTTQQELRSMTRPNVFHDQTGLEARLSYFRWFPTDITRYLLASLLSRISEEEALAGRAGQTGDEAGARLIASRLVRDLMRVCFLLEEAYAPYPKWLGTAFAQLSIGAELGPMLLAILGSEQWEERDKNLGQAYELVADAYNKTNMTPENRLAVKPFHDRPFSVLVLDSEVSQALLSQIEHPALQHLKSRRPIGSIEIVSDNTDLLEDHTMRDTLRGLYRP